MLSLVLEVHRKISVTVLFCYFCDYDAAHLLGRLRHFFRSACLSVCLCVLVCVHGGIVWPACQRFTLLCLIVRMFQVNNAHFFHPVTHTHTRLTALCPGLPRWTGTRKVKPVWIFLKQESVSGSGISWAICSSQITMPAPHHSVFLQARCPSCRPANSAKAMTPSQRQTEHCTVSVLLRRLALLLLMPYDYCANVPQLLGESAMKQRHLQKLGYNVVTVSNPFNELSSFRSC